MVKVWSLLSSRVLKDQKLLRSPDLMEALCRAVSMHVSSVHGYVYTCTCTLRTRASTGARLSEESTMYI